VESHLAGTGVSELYQLHEGDQATMNATTKEKRSLERQIHDLKAEREVLRSALQSETLKAEYLHFIIKDLMRVVSIRVFEFMPKTMGDRVKRILIADPRRIPGMYAEHPFYARSSILPAIQRSSEVCRKA